MGLFNFFKHTSLIPLETVIAADKGDVKAKQELSYAFDHGLTSDEHNRLRKMAYSPLAAKGDANAQYWMGFLSLYVDNNTQQALYWFLESANRGNTESMRDLAFGYSEFANDPEYSISSVNTGFGFDAAKERFWKLRAAELGDHQAQADLAFDFKIEGDIENAIRMFLYASESNECKVLLKAYKGLAEIYGNPSTQNYDINRQKEYLVKILEMKQNNIYDMDAYDEFAYSSAAFDLGYALKKEYEESQNPLLLRRYVYCFLLSFTHGHQAAKSLIDQSGYMFSGNEIELWQNHARTLSFYLP